MEEIEEMKIRMTVVGVGVRVCLKIATQTTINIITIYSVLVTKRLITSYVFIYISILILEV